MSAYADGFHGHTSRGLHVREVLDGFFTRGSVDVGLGTGSAVPVDPLGECIVAAFPWTLLGPREDGSVVTWGGGLKPLMGVKRTCLFDLGRWLRRHVERVANFLVGLQREGSAGTVMKFMMGSLQMVPSSRGKGFRRR